MFLSELVNQLFSLSDLLIVCLLLPQQLSMLTHAFGVFLSYTINFFFHVRFLIDFTLQSTFLHNNVLIEIGETCSKFLVGSYIM